MKENFKYGNALLSNNGPQYVVSGLKGLNVG